MKRLAQTLVAVCAVLSAATALADTKEFADGQVTVDFPKGWTLTQNGPMTQAVEPKQEAVMVAFIVEPAKLADAITALGNTIKATDVKIDDKFTNVGPLNGMAAQAKKGTAKIEGKEAKLGLLIVETPNKKNLVVFGVLDASKSEAHKAEMNGTMMSPKPAKK